MIQCSQYHLTQLLCRWMQLASRDTPSKQLSQSRASSPQTESAFKLSLSDPGARTSITITGRSPSRAQRAAAKAPSADPPQPPSSPTRAVLGGLDADPTSSRAVASIPEGNEGALRLRTMMQRRPFKHSTHVEYYAMPPGIKVCKLCCSCIHRGMHDATHISERPAPAPLALPPRRSLPLPCARTDATSLKERETKIVSLWRSKEGMNKQKG